MPMPSTTNTSSDSDTAPITGEPAFATVRTSALKPSAAIAMIVRFVDTTRVGATSSMAPHRPHVTPRARETRQ